MSEIIDAFVAAVNEAGRAFCEYAGGMFLQTGVLVAVLLCADLFLRRRVRATLRYWIWMLVFVKLLLPPSLCLPTGIGYWLGHYAPPIATDPEQVVEATSKPVHPESTAPAEMSPPSDSVSVPAAAEPVAPAQQVATDSEPLTWQGDVFMLWIAGVLVFAGLVMQRWRFVKGLIARSEPVPPDLVDVLDGCRRRMGVRGRVGLRLSPDAFSPAVCGLLGPTILVPRALLDRLSPERLRAVLIHELAHVKRGDLWANSLQTVLQVAYFYNPLVWLANAVVRRVREQAVDEMSLVALGAEARSYGNTLIDIAEMAFLRVSPALRLIGVAESRKSLEGRIKHMMTRPMPKSARVGVIGVLAVVATGVILLPMARAQTETAKPQFTATLPHGVTVELTGVCNWPGGQAVCWKPDGSRPDQPLRVTKWNARPRPNDYGLMLHITGPNDLELSWNTIEGSDSWEGSCDVVDVQGNRLDDYTAATALMKEGLTQTALRVGIATGPWTTISSYDGRSTSYGGRGGVLWSQVFEDARGTFIVATAEWRKDRTERIVAIDTEGRTHVSPGGSVAAGNMNQMTTRFDGLRGAQIKEFQYQVRPYEWVEFEDVSLRPGQGTDTQVQWGGLGKGCDMAVESFELSPGRTKGTYRPVVSIRNRGEAASPQIVVRFHTGDPTVDARDHAAGPLNPGAVWNETTAEFFPTDGVHTMHVALDPADLVDELDETNNRAALRIVVKDGQVVEQSAVSAPAERSGAGEVFRVHEVNRSVAEFPPGEDFSTPEAAYATINRMDRDDPSAWKRVSVARLANRFGVDSDRGRAADPEWAKVLASARIQEVLIWNMTKAAVMAELPQESSGKKIVDPFDVRFLQLENGRWLNIGNGRFASIEAARTHFMGWMERETSQADVMRDPLQHADEIKQAARRIFENIRDADYAEILSYYRNGRNGKWAQDGWKKFPTWGLYMVHTDYPSFALWCSTHFQDNPIVDIQLGDVFIGDALVLDKTGWPTVPYKLTLKDGTILSGTLPFRYVVNRGQGKWEGMEGIDWHLWPSGTKQQ